METAELLCQKTPGRYLGETRVSVFDTNGYRITGEVYKKETLQVNILEDHGDKAFVLLPKGMTKKTAWIDSKNLN